MRKLRSARLVLLILLLGLGTALALRAFMRRNVNAPVSASCALVELAPSGLSIDGVRLMPLEDIHPQTPVIPPLQAELTARGTSCLKIEADDSVKYVILVSVMHTARVAGVAKIDVRPP